MFFLINNFSGNMCQIQKTLTIYITTRTKLGYFKMRPDNLSRSKINFPFSYDKEQTCSYIWIIDSYSNAMFCIARKYTKHCSLC